MESTNEILSKLEILRAQKSTKTGSGETNTEELFYDAEAIVKQQCEIDNAIPGNLPYYDCKVCLNRGVVFKAKYNKESRYWEEIAVRCRCRDIRDQIFRLKKSGLKNLTEKKFTNFTTFENWQKYIYSSARDYAKNPQGWFYIGGQPGCGKTHICSAIVNYLMDSGRAAHYMLWEPTITELKQNATEGAAYNAIMEVLIKCEVLYIDDFFKKQDGGLTASDVGTTFKIINYRYIEQLPTIISSELSISDIIQIDEALGSRIAEMTDKESVIYIAKDKTKNQRLRQRHH